MVKVVDVHILFFYEIQPLLQFWLNLVVNGKHARVNAPHFEIREQVDVQEEFLRNFVCTAASMKSIP